MRMYQLETIQGGYPDGEPFEAESLEVAQEEILALLGYQVSEVEDD